MQLSSMFEVRFEVANHVHIHLMMDEAEVEAAGFEKAELCCHHCGQSKLVKYATSQHERDLFFKIRLDFLTAHKDCHAPVRDGKYKQRCPNFRTSSEFIDLRGTGGPVLEVQE